MFCIRITRYTNKLYLIDSHGLVNFDAKFGKAKLLISIKDIGETTAITFMGELLLLPPNLPHREWVKFAGLDPRVFDSSKSVHKMTRLSKTGNRHICSAPYIHTLSAKQYDYHLMT